MTALNFYHTGIFGLHSALLRLSGSCALILVLQDVEFISHRQCHCAGRELIIVGFKHRSCVQFTITVIRSQKIIDVQLQYQAFVKQCFVKGEIEIVGGPYNLHISKITLDWNE